MTDLSRTISNSLRYYPLGEKAITVVFGDSIDPEISQKIRLLEGLLKKKPFAGIVTTVAAYTTLCIHYDPILVRSHPAFKYTNTQEFIIDYVSTLLDQLEDLPYAQADVMIIPVCYGGQYGPDLEEVALHTQLSIEEVIARHASNTYQVYMMGFMPGFPYLGGLDKQLATPRKETPRPIVTQGSVGIAGMQTGVYPLDSPGGWQLIGRTPLRLFDPLSADPILLKSGQQLRFEPMDHAHFEEFQRDQYENKNS